MINYALLLGDNKRHCFGFIFILHKLVLLCAQLNEVLSIYLGNLNDLSSIFFCLICAILRKCKSSAEDFELKLWPLIQKMIWRYEKDQIYFYYSSFQKILLLEDASLVMSFAI